jgi:hypothetical protein
MSGAEGAGGTSTIASAEAIVVGTSRSVCGAGGGRQGKGEYLDHAGGERAPQRGEDGGEDGADDVVEEESSDSSDEGVGERRDERQRGLDDLLIRREGCLDGLGVNTSAR